MGEITFLLGGARSGKSTLALKLAEKQNNNKLFIATAIPSDALMVAKIQRHQEDRDNSWKSLSKYKDFNQLKIIPEFKEAKTVLIDCITLLVSNQLIDFDINWEEITEENIEKVYSAEEKIIDSVNELLEICSDKRTYIVSNEVGMGIVPDNMFANYYRDILGRVNQLIAKKSNTVYFMIAGIPIKIKGEGNELIY